MSSELKLKNTKIEKLSRKIAAPIVKEVEKIVHVEKLVDRPVYIDRPVTEVVHHPP